MIRVAPTEPQLLESSVPGRKMFLPRFCRKKDQEAHSGLVSG